MLGALLEVPEILEDRFIVPRFHLLGVANVGWFAFAFDTASTSLASTPGRSVSN